MTAANRPLMPPQSIRRSNEAHGLSSVRSQAAFVRTLLDELERTVPAGSDALLSAQLVEELARLGCRFLEVASALTAVVDDEQPAELRCA